MTEPVAVGVIGLGDISTVYLNAIERSPLLKLASVATRDPERAGAVGRERGARGESVEALLRSDDVGARLEIVKARGLVFKLDHALLLLLTHLLSSPSARELRAGR